MLRAWWHRSLAGHRPVTLALTFAIGAVGGGLAWQIGLPLPFLLGPMLAVVLAGTLPWQPGPERPYVPQHWRTAFVPVIGVAIGAAFPPDFMDQARLWWISLLMLLLIIPVMHLLGYLIYLRLGGVDRKTAFFAAMPGGFIEALDMGERAGADQQMLIMLQFLRLVICIIAIPIGFSLIEGHAVGGASGATWSTGHGALEAFDILLLVALGLVGWLIAQKLRFPAAHLSGPLLLSGLAHAMGLTDAAPPQWTIVMTQWVIGTSLGVRLIGFSARRMRLALTLACAALVAMLGIASLAAWAVHGLVEQPFASVLLAFAPGGVSEMALVAVSLQLSAVYVTLHHLARIILAVLAARISQRAFLD